MASVTVKDKLTPHLKTLPQRVHDYQIRYCAGFMRDAVRYARERFLIPGYTARGPRGGHLWRPKPSRSMLTSRTRALKRAIRFEFGKDRNSAFIFVDPNAPGGKGGVAPGRGVVAGKEGGYARFLSDQRQNWNPVLRGLTMRRRETGKHLEYLRGLRRIVAGGV